MELNTIREKAIRYESNIRYFEPKQEMKSIWNLWVDVGMYYIDGFTNTVR